MMRAIKSWAGRGLALLLVLTFIIPQLGCQANGENSGIGAANNQGVSKTGYYLDTVCQITVYGVDPDSDLGKSLAAMSEEEQEKEVLQLITDAFLECDRYEKLLSKTISSSEISQINAAAGKGVTVSDTTIEVIEKGLEYGDLSGGAFDITIGKASELWDFHDIDENHEAAGNLPDEAALKEAVGHVDYRKVKMEGNRVTLLDPDMEIDLGGIAKGYISDRVTSYLEDRGVISAVVNLGGNIVTLGSKAPSLLSGLPDSGEDAPEDANTVPFSVGIADPRSDGGGILGTFPCVNKVVVTSGTYERYVLKDGVKYHHILDVKTGYPVDTDLDSVTIIAEKGMGADADGLSTTCLALGMEKGLALIRSLDGVEAVFVDVDGNVKLSDDAMELER